MNLKKTIIAPLAALMLAGALSAISGATSVNATTPFIVVGEGSAPMPMALPSANNSGDASSLTAKF